MILDLTKRLRLTLFLPPEIISTHLLVDVRKRVGYDADKNRLDRIWNPGNSYTTKHTKVTHGPGRVVTFQMLVILATTFNYQFRY